MFVFLVLYIAHSPISSETWIRFRIVPTRFTAESQFDQFMSYFSTTFILFRWRHDNFQNLLEQTHLKFTGNRKLFSEIIKDRH